MEIMVRAEIVLTNVIMLFEFLSFFYVIFQREFRTYSYQRLIAALIWGLLWVVSMLLGFDWRNRVLGPISAFFFIYFVLIWILFDLSFAETILIGLANWLILSMIEENIIILVRKPYNTGKRALDWIIMITISGIIWVIYAISRHKYNSHAFRLPIKIWIMLDAIMLIWVTMLSYFTYIIVKIIPSSEIMYFGQWLLLLFGIAMIILLLVVVYYYNSSYEYRFQKEIMEMQITQQKEYFERLLEREVETKKFRHDIMNDLLELRNYCENHECLQMRRYLEKMTGVVTKISKSSYNVGNNVVNTILNYYLIPIGEKYYVEINGMLPNKIAVDDRDICIICANIVSNAVEAAGSGDNGKIWIDFDSGKDYLHIQVRNTYEGNIEFDEIGIPKTTKSDKHNHGIGIKNVFEIVKKNGGTCEVEAKNGVFKVDIFIKM